MSTDSCRMYTEGQSDMLMGTSCMQRVGRVLLRRWWVRWGGAMSDCRFLKTLT